MSVARYNSLSRCCCRVNEFIKWCFKFGVLIVYRLVTFGGVSGGVFFICLSEKKNKLAKFLLRVFYYFYFVREKYNYLITCWKYDEEKARDRGKQTFLGVRLN